MADDLRDHCIAVVSIYPGLVRTEAVMAFAAYLRMADVDGRQPRPLALDQV